MSVIPRLHYLPIRKQGDEEQPEPEEAEVVATTTPAPAVPAPPAPTGAEPETFYLPIYIVTAVSSLVFIFAPLCVRKGPNAGITKCCIMLTTFTLWLFWITVYIAQMNPLLGPRLHNCSLAWVGYKWGKNAKSLSTDLEETEF